MRRLIPALFLLAAVAGSARAADEPKPNTLTPKEIADGWILLFDGETTFGWKIDGSAKVADGTLLLGGDKEAQGGLTSPFVNFEIDFNYRQDKQGAFFKVQHWPGDTGGVGLLPATESGWYHAVITVRRDAGGTQTQDHKLYSPTGKLLHDSNKSEKAGWTHPNKVGFETKPGASIALRNIKLRPPEMKSLFNGKDLTGWKKYTADDKRAKTEFSVTKEGFLHLKNGPGDLQSEGQYGDFVLQAECRTNGKNLNSGVFFRCIPGDYQNGYEAQIHNGFGAAPKEYVVEEYDPKTHELKDKTKVKSAALDYGTGAIYRRVPARTHAANDNEWFTMTVVARGRHIATWVNGVQQVDWTDNRPLKDNPRNGCRLEKGPISLQGHDSTTDIDFRSIRIVELPR